jgi:hypothetical protein
MKEQGGYQHLTSLTDKELMRLTHEQRMLRNESIVNDFDLGMSINDLVSEYGLCLSQLRQVVLYFTFKPGRHFIWKQRYKSYSKNQTP